MSILSLIILIVVYLFSSMIGVVTGSNSLIAVPVMFELGVDERVAVATNMFGLTFMSIGGAIPFVRNGSVKVRELRSMIFVTLIGSAIGALIVGLVSNSAIKIIVTVAMFAVVLFTVFKPQPNGNNDGPLATKKEPRSGAQALLGYIAVFLLAIYGGLFSGGYVTILTPVLVTFFGFSFTGSIAATKVVNVFSSLIATVVFLYQGLVDLRLGLILAVTMFAGAYIGAHFAVRLNERILRLIFYSAVILLALKMIFDLVSGN